MTSGKFIAICFAAQTFSGLRIHLIEGTRDHHQQQFAIPNIFGNRCCCYSQHHFFCCCQPTKRANLLLFSDPVSSALFVGKKKSGRINQHSPALPCVPDSVRRPGLVESPWTQAVSHAWSAKAFGARKISENPCFFVGNPSTSPPLQGWTETVSVEPSHSTTHCNYWHLGISPLLIAFTRQNQRLAIPSSKTNGWLSQVAWYHLALVLNHQLEPSAAKPWTMIPDSW